MSSMQTYQSTPGAIWHLNKTITNIIGKPTNINTGDTLMKKVENIYNLVNNKLSNTNSIANYEVSIITINDAHSDSKECHNDIDDKEDCTAVDAYIVKFEFHDMELIGFLKLPNQYGNISAVNVTGSIIPGCMLVDKKLYSEKGELLICRPLDSDACSFSFSVPGEHPLVYMQLQVITEKVFNGVKIGAKSSLHQHDENSHVHLSGGDKCNSIETLNQFPYLYLYTPSKGHQIEPINDIELIEKNNESKVDARLSSASLVVNDEIYYPCLYMNPLKREDQQQLIIYVADIRIYANKHISTMFNKDELYAYGGDWTDEKGSTAAGNGKPYTLNSTDQINEYHTFMRTDGTEKTPFALTTDLQSIYKRENECNWRLIDGQSNSLSPEFFNTDYVHIKSNGSEYIWSLNYYNKGDAPDKWYKCNDMNLASDDKVDDAAVSTYSAEIASILVNNVVWRYMYKATKEGSEERYIYKYSLYEISGGPKDDRPYYTSYNEMYDNSDGYTIDSSVVESELVFAGYIPTFDIEHKQIKINDVARVLQYIHIGRESEDKDPIAYTYTNSTEPIADASTYEWYDLKDENKVGKTDGFLTFCTNKNDKLKSSVKLTSPYALALMLENNKSLIINFIHIYKHINQDASEYRYWLRSMHSNNVIPNDTKMYALGDNYKLTEEELTTNGLESPNITKDTREYTYAMVMETSHRYDENFAKTFEVKDYMVIYKHNSNNEYIGRIVEKSKYNDINTMDFINEDGYTWFETYGDGYGLYNEIPNLSKSNYTLYKIIPRYGPQPYIASAGVMPGTNMSDFLMFKFYGDAHGIVACEPSNYDTVKASFSKRGETYQLLANHIINKGTPDEKEILLRSDVFDIDDLIDKRKQKTWYISNEVGEKQYIGHQAILHEGNIFSKTSPGKYDRVEKYAVDKYIRSTSNGSDYITSLPARYDTYPLRWYDKGGNEVTDISEYTYDKGIERCFVEQGRMEDHLYIATQPMKEPADGMAPGYDTKQWYRCNSEGRIYAKEPIGKDFVDDFIGDGSYTTISEPIPARDYDSYILVKFDEKQ